MIYGLFNQGVKCNDCGMCAHKKCQGIVPHTCGVHTQEKHGRINIGYYTQRLKEDQWRVNVEGMDIIIKNNIKNEVFFIAVIIVE